MQKPATNTSRHIRPADVGSATISGGFWGSIVETNRTTTIPHILDKCRETGVYTALETSRNPSGKLDVHQFRDSDLAKSAEAAAYALHSEPDDDLKERLHEIVELFAAAQHPDGYLNSYYSHVGLEKRWTNLRDMHELYCSGHIMEAAVAHYTATGSAAFLETAERLADHIRKRFGPDDGQVHGYPGHEEIELALVKLYGATGKRKYLELSAYFIDERGKLPHFFEAEAKERGDDPYRVPTTMRMTESVYEYYQAHRPVRQQDTAEGHSVRAGYLYSGMADIARETGDESLAEACRRLWSSITRRRMYLTGGIGSSNDGERFTFDYDLPNEEAYAETCAAISLVFFAQRMLRLELKGEYGDAMERALYNGVLGGVSRSGDRFFYANPLSFDPSAVSLRQVRADAERKPWYSCACCPPNIARLIASLAQYIYFTPAKADPDSRGSAPASSAPEAAVPLVAVNLFVQSTVSFESGGIDVVIEQKTGYPDQGSIELTVSPEQDLQLTLAVRIPGWASGDTRDDGRNGPAHGPEREPRLLVCGAETAISDVLLDGYAYITRIWRKGDTIELEFPMRIRHTQVHPAVRHDTWLVALERGPIVYCVEEKDNGRNLADLALCRDAEIATVYEPALLGGTTILRAEGVRHAPSTGDDALYYEESPESMSSAERGKAPGDPGAFADNAAAGHGKRHAGLRKITLTAVPFAFRSNRTPGEMRVWLHQA